MNIYAIGDLHLSFNENIDKPMDVFGAGWDNHAERIKSAWNDAVEPEDIVIVPGDISWGLRLEEAMDDINWIHCLNGTKIISKGNHDLWWSKINYLNTLYEDVVFLQNTSYYCEDENIVICATRGWPYPGSSDYSEHDEKMYLREQLRLKMGLESAREKTEDAKLIVALHYPPCDANGTETEITKILEEYGASECVYGHLHGSVAFRSGPKGRFRGVNYSLVSMDYLGAKPKLIYEGTKDNKRK